MSFKHHCWSPDNPLLSGRLVESGLETKETQDKFFGMEPLEADGKVLGMVPMWLPPIGCIPWDHERWHKFIDSNGPWYGRLATLLSRICQWQLSRMTGADLDMFRFAKKKRANGERMTCTQRDGRTGHQPLRSSSLSSWLMRMRCPSLLCVLCVCVMCRSSKPSVRGAEDVACGHAQQG